MIQMKVAVCIGVGILMAAASAMAAPVQVIKTSAGLVMRHDDETLQLSVCGSGVLHIVAGPGNSKAASPAAPWLVQPCVQGAFDFT
jgi:hypothetical protein